MSKQKKLLPIYELQPGMISANNIKFAEKSLLTEGVEITDTAIRKLKETYIIDKVEVYIDEDKPLKYKAETMDELEYSLNEFSSNLEDIFNDIDNLKSNGISSLRNFSQKVQGEFESAGLVIKNIIFYGSKNNIYRHSVNVAAISFILGKWLGMNEEEINLLTYASLLHDFGKTQLDNSILKKESSLTPEEYAVYKTHPVIAYHLIKEIPDINASVGLGVLMHHEQIDGSGYPLGIKDNKIHKFAKIIAIADIFDKVNSDNTNGPFEGLKAIKDLSLGKLDCSYSNMFINHAVNYYMGESVTLSDNRSCKIIKLDTENLTKPLLLADDGFLDLKSEKDLYVKSLIV
ncbi:HD-GYP domain-containing protein (c-di-GMP phosphodiesterase class II) [Clostridium acetobutylicum]|uniref:HD-GYP hydrolase domain containing protein n=2 Tax=Clostridium acetobutylicum TaxID=1488 RepID=Q97FV6_CLOAB|nr:MULTISPECIES: HD-GYP domain-containing protein [Clostridium]AAK80567.1 HD-GYP hydrolase domain containing protein [Clostridium acetobutylicum ATCC 824]ADZ21666.1 HD-GYP hydrolase domain containing protein [Clostridium acetobutylicum EA 2018]AEI32471.1 HD-GYP hydrolase domain-containing protein [Clostridium acetobutylicum DSM 1731]AWV79016.1 HD-GYP domain-containing protein [Clostridium acetobutylicum]MBC2395024.1 HD-GYP domain-containing protein [Clostridium acetobutylicum]